MTAPFDTAVLNDVDRFHLIGDVLDCLSQLGALAAFTKQVVRDRLIENKQYLNTYREDTPEIRG